MQLVMPLVQSRFGLALSDSLHLALSGRLAAFEQSLICVAMPMVC